VIFKMPMRSGRFKSKTYLFNCSMIKKQRLDKLALISFSP